MDIDCTGSLFFSIYKKKLSLLRIDGHMMWMFVEIMICYIFSIFVWQRSEACCQALTLCLGCNLSQLSSLYSANAVSVTLTLKSLHPRQKLS